MPYRLVFLGILLIRISVLCAQTDMIRNYTVADGLVMNSVRGFHQDAAGFIWIYTWDGISRYEGYRFRNYVAGKELQHGMVNAMHETTDGTIYVALNNGSVATIQNLEVTSHIRIEGDIINSFFQNANGQLMASSDFTSIGRFHNNRLVAISETKTGLPVTKAVSFGDDYLVIMSGRSTVGIMNLDMQIVQRWNHATDFFECLYINRDEQLLIGTAEGCKVLRIESAISKVFSMEDADFIPANAPWKHQPIHAIAQSTDGTYWFGTPNGLIQYKPGIPWHIYTKDDGLPSNAISTLFLDRSSTLWIGTEVGMASMHTRRVIREVDATKGIVFHSMLPLTDGSVIGLGNYREIFTIDSTGVVTHQASLSTQPDPSRAICNYRDQLQVISASESYVLPLRNYTASRFADVPGTPGGISTLHDQVYLLSDYGKLCFTPPGQIKNVHGIDQRIHINTSCGKNKILIGTWQEGLVLAAQDPEHPCTLAIEKELTKWLPGKEIRSLLVDTRGNIWVGMRYHGIVRLSCDPGFEKCDVQYYTMSDGLTSNWIKQLVEDRAGNIWAGSISGLDKLIPHQDRYRVFSFSRVFGYYGNIMKLVAGADNTLWCSANENVVQIRDERMDTMPPPNLYITEAVLGGASRTTHLPGLISLPYNHNSANFAFAAPDFRSGDQRKYTFRLVGSADSSWTAPATLQQIAYGNLKPGDYQFEVASIGWNGLRGVPVTYAFRITPPYWRQAWFITLLSLAGGILLFWMYSFRIAQLQRIQRMRERIASDLHDEIGSTLTHVNILSEIGKKTVQGVGQPHEIFERIGTEMQSSAEALDDIIWSVKSQRDATGDIIARMRQYATELFTSANIEFRLTEDIHSDSVMDLEFRRDLYLVYKELLRNIIRHASATYVDILLRMDKKHITLTVSDNGRGFQPDALTRRSGLANIESRVQKWRGTVDWNSAPGKGTRVHIQMKP